MTLAALELNDQSLLIQADDGAMHAEPGFARLTGEGIVTGEEARAVAWREPQHVYDQYWCHLNQTPLPIRHRFARHHADIAFSQLRKLWQNAGSTESLMVLVPGSFADAQISLLLGMVEALPARVSVVIDSALAACADAQADTLFVDLQMQESVLTVCRPGQGSIRVVEQEIFPGLGMAQIQNSLARHISDLLIENYRFDPLHSSEAEQAIFDQIPHWLNRLRWETSISTTLTAQQGEYPCILDRGAIKALVGGRLAGVRSFLDKWRGCSLLLSQASASLTGLVDDFSEAEVKSQTAGTQRCLSHSTEILGQVDGLYRLRELKRAESDMPASVHNGEALATHLLSGDLALPLSRPVSVRLEEDGPRISSEIAEDAVLTVVLRNRALETLRLGEDVALPQTCRAGESIRIGAHEFRLIRVRDD
jgi:hypothetical protein